MFNLNLILFELKQIKRTTLEQKRNNFKVLELKIVLILEQLKN